MAYIHPGEEPVIYLWGGRAVAYLSGHHVYGFNGRHLGWFDQGVIFNHCGEKIGFTKSECPGLPGAEPVKMGKLIQQVRSIKETAPPKPLSPVSISNENFVSFLTSGT